MIEKFEDGVAGLISINKPHTDNIFIHGTKLVEWRKSPLPLGKYYIYETKRGGGCGKVIGEFRVVEHTRYSAKIKVDLKFIPPVVIRLGCISTDELYKYGSRKSVWANLLNGVKLYDKPKELGEFKKYIGCEEGEECDCCVNRFFPTTPYSSCRLKGFHRPPQSWQRVEEMKE